jgi:hypothetical protein
MSGTNIGYAPVSGACVPTFKQGCTKARTGRLARRAWSRSHVKLSDRAFDLFVTFVLLAVMAILAVIVYCYALPR